VIELQPREVNTTEDKEPHFSYSQMSTYLACSWKYYLKYMKRIPGLHTLNLASGKAVHKAIEYNSLYKMKKEEDMPMSDLLDISADAHDRYAKDVEGSTPKQIGENKDENQGIITLYRRTQAPQIKPIATEYEFRIELPEDDVQDYMPVIGFVDSYAEVPDVRPGPPGGKVIALEDYKRVNKKRGQKEVDISPQLTLYDYVYYEQTGSLPDVVGYRQMGFLKKEGPYSLPLYRQPVSMEARQKRWRRVLNQMKAVQQAIRKGVFIPCDDPKVCGWCDYQHICQFKAEE
jgi:CRISPR/Cas system-associated exonuclease Cas4 (RecB family)